MRQQLHDSPLKEYLKQKDFWTDETFQNINWSAHVTLIWKNKTPKDRVHILKVIHGWRPTKL